MNMQITKAKTSLYICAVPVYRHQVSYGQYLKVSTGTKQKMLVDYMGLVTGLMCDYIFANKFRSPFHVTQLNLPEVWNKHSAVSLYFSTSSLS